MKAMSRVMYVSTTANSNRLTFKARDSNPNTFFQANSPQSSSPYPTAAESASHGHCGPSSAKIDHRVSLWVRHQTRSFSGDVSIASPIANRIKPLTATIYLANESQSVSDRGTNNA